MSKNVCNCRICQLSRHLDTLAEKATEEERKALNEVWSRMEYAETELEVQQAKREGKWPNHSEIDFTEL